MKIVPYYQENKHWHIIEKHLGSILDMLNDTVIIIDKEGTIIYVNEEYELQVGVKRENVLGRNIHKTSPNDMLAETLRSGKPIKKKRILQ